MAFYIDLEKINETDEFVEYKYFTSQDNAGVILLRKSDGNIKEIIPAPLDKHGHIFERAARALMRCWKDNNYPDKTYWAS